MADRLVEAGAKVTAVGRRQDRLDEFVSKHGPEKAKAMSFDVSDRDNIPRFAAEVTSASPDLDCVFLNAGVQRHHNFTKPETVELEGFYREMDVNFSSFVALTHAFIPFFISKESPTSFIFTTSTLGIIPASTMPAYSASKAALRAYILCLRDQLRDTHLKIIELSPPAVQTELHDYLGHRGRQIGMPLNAFTEEAYQELAANSDEIIIVGNIVKAKEIVVKQRQAFVELSTMIRGI